MNLMIILSTTGALKGKKYSDIIISHPEINNYVLWKILLHIERLTLYM